MCRFPHRRAIHLNACHLNFAMYCLPWSMSLLLSIHVFLPLVVRSGARAEAVVCVAANVAATIAGAAICADVSAAAADDAGAGAVVVIVSYAASIVASPAAAAAPTDVAAIFAATVVVVVAAAKKAALPLMLLLLLLS
jgi:hypothetical protein